MKKKLLSEAQVRRFMGLAGLNPLNEMANYKKDDMSNEAMYEEDLMEEEDEELDVEMEDEAGDADVEMDEEVLMRIKKNLKALEDDLAPLVDQVEGGEDMEEPEMDMDMGDDEEDDMDMDAELEDVDVEPTEDEKEEMEEQIVNEVARSVAKRIVEAKRAHKRMNEALGRKNRK